MGPRKKTKWLSENECSDGDKDIPGSFRPLFRSLMLTPTYVEV